MSSGSQHPRADIPIADVADDDVFAERGYYFPYGYVRGFLEFIHGHRDLIEVLTYDDLDFGDDYDYSNHYRGERERWDESLRSGERSSEKVYVLIQHDVDRIPERTHALVEDEARLGLRSNVMIFNKRVNRKKLQKEGVVEIGDYPIDLARLRLLHEASGFVIGYHSNAFERALFDRELAERIFLQDVKELRSQIPIRYFSPHGGVRNAEGQSNAFLEIPRELSQDLRWVHNRFGVRFDGAYSDGAINAVRRDPEERDLRRFVQRWRAGKRYRVLIHPQYYNVPFFRSPKLARASWYSDLIDEYTSNPSALSWRDVTLVSL